MSNSEVGVNQNGQIEVGFGNGGFGGQQPTTTRRPPPVTTTTTNTTTTTVFGKLNHFGHVQILKISPEDQNKMGWTGQKQLFVCFKGGMGTGAS